MHWTNSQTPSFSGTADTKPAVVETFDLVDESGNVVKRFAKSADGSISETSQSFTAAVARVVQGTVDTALSGADVTLKFGSLIVETGSGKDIANDDDGTELIAFLQAHVTSIPADHVTDDTGGQFSVHCHPGVNTLAFESGDAKLTFSETTAGADASRALLTSFSLPATLPVVPLTTPAAQDIIDALLALGLVTQSD